MLTESYFMKEITYQYIEGQITGNIVYISRLSGIQVSISTVSFYCKQLRPFIILT